MTGSETDETDSNGLVYAASVSKTLETGSLSASLTRSSDPSGDGDLLDSTRLRLSGEHRFTQKLRTSLGIDLTDNETIVNRLGRDTNRGIQSYIRIRPRVSWRWSRQWELAGEYTYSKNTNQNSSEATSNAAYMTLSYRPLKTSLSR